MTSSSMNLCRACLVTKESFKYVLFENVSPELYCFCTSIEILEQEQLPRTLCNNCYDQLERYSDFKKTCIQSQTTLLGYQDSLKAEKNEVLISKEFGNKLFIDKNEIKEEGSNDYNDDLIQSDDFLDYVVVKKPNIRTKRKKRKEKLKDKKSTKLKPKQHFNFTCDSCGKKFKYEERLQAHTLKHQGINTTISCKVCDKIFMTWSGLQRHNNSEHTQVKLESLMCLKCGKIFKNKESLKTHSKLHSSVDKSQYVCDICGKNFTTKFVLKGHLQIHNENRERTHSCEHCGKKFFNNGVLFTHVARVHTGRRYVCQVCNYPFTDKYNLSKHMLIHQGVKNFKCDICHKTFGTQSSLVIHKRTHSGERPYCCTFCPKAFISRNRLVDHHRIHSGERPFRCNVCSQAYTQRGSLKRHMKIHNKMPLGM